MGKRRKIFFSIFWRPGPWQVWNTIHFNETYINYRIQWNGWPQICAVLPWIYIIPSFHVICKIFSVYLSANWTRPEPGLNQHVFLVISLSQLTVFIFFLFDWLMVRLPSTGLFTSWCASIEPNHFLKFIFMMAYYTNYCAMIFPFLMPVVRLVVVSFPRNHFKVRMTQPGGGTFYRISYRQKLTVVSILALLDQNYFCNIIFRFHWNNLCAWSFPKAILW